MELGIHKKILVKSIALVATLGVLSIAPNAQAYDDNSDNQQQQDHNAYYMANNQSQDDALAQTINCWGWDGSGGGNQTKRMTRGQCFDAHGVVADRQPARQKQPAQNNQ